MAHDWSLVLPLSDLAALQGLPDQVIKLQEENRRLRREIDALRILQTDALTLIADLRKEINKR